MLEEFKRLSNNKEFSEWKKKHPKSFLTHVFMCEPPEIQFGYADSSGERITTFTLLKHSVRISKDEEIFKSLETKLKPLILSKVKISWWQALQAAVEFQSTHYKQHGIQKKIVILQHLACGQVFNITFVTNTFHTLNMKIDTSKAKVLQHTLTSLFEFAKKE